MDIIVKDRSVFQEAIRALEALPEEKQDAALRAIRSYCPYDTFASAIRENPSAVIRAVVDEMLRKGAMLPVPPVTDGVVEFHSEIAGAAIDRVMAECYPSEDREEHALSEIFDEHWNEIWAAIRESAFLVGAAYGWRLAGGAR